MEEIRLQKFLAEAGVASRRKCEEYIEQGRVTVNGKIAILGTKVNPEKDTVLLDGKKIEQEEQKVYLLLHKPIGYVTTVSDEYDRDKVMDLIDIKERVVPVGRLDMYTSGALILSNDGDFIYHITHPKHEIDKTYVAKVRGRLTEDELDKLRRGVRIEDYITRPAKVTLLSYDAERERTEIEITIHEGKNRQVRKMIEAIGRETIQLHRSKIGFLQVKDLKPGTWRYLKPEEVDKLRHL